MPLRNFYDLRVPISYQIWNTAWGSKKLESEEKSEPQFLNKFLSLSFREPQIRSSFADLEAKKKIEP